MFDMLSGGSRNSGLWVSHSFGLIEDQCRVVVRCFAELDLHIWREDICVFAPVESCWGAFSSSRYREICERSRVGTFQLYLLFLSSTREPLKSDVSIRVQSAAKTSYRM